MAFQAGTPVNPKLGALDYSGYTNAAMIEADAIKGLGETIGRTIERFSQKKAEQKEKQIRLDAVSKYVKDPEMAKFIANDPEAGMAVLQLKEIDQNKQALNQAILNSTNPQTGRISWNMVPRMAQQAGATNMKEVMGLASQARKSEYENMIMSMDAANKSAMQETMQAYLDPNANLVKDKDTALSMFAELGGTDVPQMNRILNDLSSGELTFQEVEDYMVMTQKGEYKGALPKKDSKKKEPTLTAFEKNQELRAKTVPQIRKLMKEGNREAAQDLIIQLGERAPNGYFMTPEEFLEGEQPLNLGGVGGNKNTLGLNL